MSELLRQAIEHRFAVDRIARPDLSGRAAPPEAVLRLIDATATRVTAVLEHDGAAYRATLAMGPVAQIVVDLPSTDGFELALKWADRWANTGAPRAASFDDSFLIETNDLALATMWLDSDARGALLASRYVSAAQHGRSTALLYRDAAWRHEIAHDAVRAERRDAETVPERMCDMLAASLALAARPTRWARALAIHAKALGGEAAPRVEIGGKPMLRARRGGVDVTVSVARRLGPGDQGRLRTIVSAHRHGSGGEVLSLIAEDLPRAAWPPPNVRHGPALPIDPRATELLELARPASTMVRPHDVDICFDGALGNRDRLGAAVELAAWWAGEICGTGPYR